MDINKHDQICEAYWNIRSEVQADPEYARMRVELENAAVQYEAVLNALPDDAQAVIERYLLIRESMGSRMLEWVCAQVLFPDTGTGRLMDQKQRPLSFQNETGVL